MKIKLGCDPEIFLKNGSDYVSAHGLVPGTKEKPHLLKYGAVQLDGTAVEFNTVPAESGAQFAENVKKVLGELRALIPNEYEFAFVPSVFYKSEVWAKVPATCKELGCNPDFNAWTGLQNNPPVPEKGYENMRTGSGHLHIGWGKDIPLSASHIYDCQYVVKALDRYFGCYERMWDRDYNRKNLYGEQGAYRPKPYGVEYRVLSNAWLNYPVLWPWLYDSCQFVIDCLEEGKDLRGVYSTSTIKFYAGKEPPPFPSNLKAA